MVSQNLTIITSMVDQTDEHPSVSVICEAKLETLEKSASLSQLRDKSTFNVGRRVSRENFADFNLETSNSDPDVSHKKSHAHHSSKEPSIISAMVSGFINYLLMFGLCCAYGMIMFSDDHNLPHRALGVKINLATAFITGLLLAAKSKVGVAIGGPDLNPVVFLGGFVSVISESIATQVGLGDDYPTSSRRLVGETSTDLFRRLGAGGGSGVDFCSPGGDHESSHYAECIDYHEQLRATAIFATAVSSAVLGLLYFLLGHFKVTRLVSYVPTSVQEAFLSCIGYKVFKYALKFCNYKPLQFIPAACVGVPLYFLKAMHVGNPAVVIPAMVLLPLVVFYIVVLCAQLDIETMRTSGEANNWMFPELPHVNFWTLWTDSYGKADKINFKAWVETLPDLLIMIVVCIIDCLLKISSTESKLPVKVDKDYEASLYGLGNIMTTACGSSVGYMQLKFNVINFGVVGNTTDRRAGVIYALLCGACFFTTIGHFNYLPRFFLGVLLFFAGTGFVAENLWGSRKYLSLFEWGEILLILVVFIFSGSLVAAVIVGILVTCVSLIMKYTRVSCIAGKPIPGGSITSCERRSYLQLGQLSHIADSWFVVFRLKGFIFFASAMTMCGQIREIVNERKSYQSFRHIRYIVFDCELLDGMDASAGKSIRKLLADLQEMHVTILWSSVTPDFVADLQKKEMIDSKRHAFSSMDLAVLYIEEVVLRYQISIQGKLLECDSMFRLQHNLQRLSDDQEPWGGVLLNFTARHGCPWKYCHKIPLREFETLLWEPNEENSSLFLIHTGKVAIFDRVPDEQHSQVSWGAPAAVYGHGWFLNRDALIKKLTKHYAVAIKDGEVLAWTAEQWWLMSQERPAMATEIWRAVMAQQAVDSGAPDWLLAQQRAVPDDDMGKNVRREEDWNPDDFQAEDDDRCVAEPSPTTPDSKNPKQRKKNPRSITGAMSHLPEQLQVMISNLEVSEVFADMGFYEPAPCLSKLPDLPQAVEQDLQVAFNTYAVLQDNTYVLPWQEASDALMYAGIPRVPLIDHSRGSQQAAFAIPWVLTEDEFISLGHAATMARLPVQLVERLRIMFSDYCKKHDWPSRIESSQVAYIIHKEIHCSVSQEVIHGVMLEMSSTGQVDESVFISMISRLVKWHEQYWTLLQCIQRFMEDPFTAKSSHDTHGLMNNELLARSLDIEDDQAAEILWATDWRRGRRYMSSWGKTLHPYDIALAVLTSCEQPTGRLPPPPKLKKGTTPKQDLPKIPEEAHRSPLLTGLSIVKAQKTVEGQRSIIALGEEKKDMSELLVDLRSAPDMIAQRVLDRTRKNVEKLSASVDDEEQEAMELERSEKSRASEMVLDCKGEPTPPIRSLRASIHTLMENPASSRAANVLSLAMGVLILLSIATMFVKPVVEHGRESAVTQVEDDFWFYTEMTLTIIFTAEYVVRLSVANALGTQTIVGFIFSPANICDVAAISPFYVEAAFRGDTQEFRLLRIVRLLRLTRIARIGRLANRSPLFPPIAMCLIVIWGIYMKTGL